MKRIGRTKMQVDPAVWKNWRPERREAHEEKFYQGKRRRKDKKEKTVTSKDGTYTCPERPNLAKKKGSRKRPRSDRTTTVRGSGAKEGDGKGRRRIKTGMDLIF